MKVKPTGAERTFQFDELFFSRTDLRGIIQFGNEVFVRISGYSAKEMFGAPHNIIRHPDMPRSVFKLFWSTIKSGEMIAAYVKNLAADGSHYWVLAAAFPTSSGYLSIRLRPSSELFGQIRMIYDSVLQAEREGGMEAGEAALQSMVRDAGYADYTALMTDMLLEEIKCRDRQLTAAQSGGLSVASARAGNKSTSEMIERLRCISAQGSEKFRSLFATVESFQAMNRVFNDKTSSLLENFHDFRLVSLNMAVASARFGETGRTLGVIAKDFQRLATDIETHLRSFAEAAGALNDGMSACSREIASLKIQMDMVDYFVRESLNLVLRDNVPISEALASLDANRKEFSELTAASVKALRARIDEIQLRLMKFSIAASEIQKFVNGLEVAKQMGAVESGRLASERHGFENYIHDMDVFNGTLRSSSAAIRNATRALLQCVDGLAHEATEAGNVLDTIFNLALSLRGRSTATASPARRAA